ncbi:uncharacterized protein LOC122459219 [Dermochelys coriacea]|uniref:uncharacterized protein LOC122459219 n=1 Tax=Dermochelys coriacea TaxID=27794 RepID=UPI001CA9984B|nr:uncharacterized protein LOC122459219 [Dermochelys coriacea]
MDAAWLNPEEQACSEQVQQIFLGSRQPYTKATYLGKWKCFSIWASQCTLSPSQSSLQSILVCLLHLKQQGLALISIKVHLAAISAFHPPVNSRLVFSQEMTIWIFNLNLVLSRLTGLTFKPLASCHLLLLSWKVAFLVAIISARRVSEIKVFMSELPYYTVLFKVQLCPNLAFLPKVVSQFHNKQAIFLPVSSRNITRTLRNGSFTRTLDMPLLFILRRTKPFRKSTQLFVAVAERMRGGLPVFAQRILSWITACIWACYEQENVLPQSSLTAHSTQAQASSAACLAQVQIQDICRVATWSLVHTFTSHYSITQQAQGSYRRVSMNSEPTSWGTACESPNVEWA